MSIGKDLAKAAASFVFSTNDVDNLLDQLKNYEIISFDIFDTLVKRDVTRPADIHELVGRIYAANTGLKISCYREMRVEAERIARALSEQEEVSLEEIFQQCKSLDGQTAEQLKELELEVELRYCYPNLPIVNLFNTLVGMGKSVVLTSDMYLPDNTIKAILRKCGISGYRKLYLSSAYRKTKHSGNLFAVVKSDYDDSNKMAHVGDNPYGDCVQAERNGFDAYLCQTEVHNCTYIKRPHKHSPIEESVMYAVANNRLKESDSLAYVIGFETLGPILAGYANWLHRHCHEDGIDHLFFLSREGKILREAYELLFPNDDILNSYLYVSRKALTIPLLSNAKDFSQMIRYLRVFLREDTLEVLCEVCELDSTAFTTALKAEGMKLDDRISNLSDAQQQSLYRIVMLIGRDYFEEQYQYATKYLAEQGVIGTVGFADIGYVGTMQRSVEDILNKEVHTVGYYLGVQNMDSEQAKSGIERFGYLFSPGHNEEIHQTVRYTTEVFEYFMLNTDGSVMSYRESESGVKPVLGESEYDEKSARLSISIQEGARDFLDVISSLDVFNGALDDIDSRSAIAPYAKFATHPLPSVLKLFSSVVFLDGNYRRIVPSYGLLQSITNPKQFAEGLNQSAAKTFFLSKALIPYLPYFEALKAASALGMKSRYRKKFY